MDAMDDIVAAHAQYLMPAHLRKGKGGRQPAMDPRDDPRMDKYRASTCYCMMRALLPAGRQHTGCRQGFHCSMLKCPECRPQQEGPAHPRQQVVSCALQDAPEDGRACALISLLKPACFLVSQTPAYASVALTCGMIPVVKA